MAQLIVRFPKSAKINSRLLIRFLSCSAFLLNLIVLIGCSDNKPTKPDDNSTGRLAGGGRTEGDDPFIGGIGDSGPNDSLPVLPGFDSATQFFPIFMSQQSCPQQQPYLIITQRSNWEKWWSDAYFCSDGRWKVSNTTMTHFGETDSTATPPDSGWVTPDSLWPEAPPIVDFGSNIVVIIALEQGVSGRYIWIKSITEDQNGTNVFYDIMVPGDDCLNLMVDPDLTATPIAAFVIPRPSQLTFGWFPTHMTYNCTWQPDPAEPLTLYYTDAPCEMGYSTGIIFEEHIFRDFLETIWQCESDRSGENPDTLIVNPDSSVTAGPATPPRGLMNLVDFNTHAVLILTADPQFRWGGGIWLNGLEVVDDVTYVDYSEMIPGDSCPTVEDGKWLRPTVAIRIPRPPRVDATFHRNTEQISCDWLVDTSWVRPD